MKLAIEKYLHLIFGIALPILYLFFFSDTPIEALKFVFPVTAILFAILIGILNNLVNMIIRHSASRPVQWLSVKINYVVQYFDNALKYCSEAVGSSLALCVMIALGIKSIVLAVFFYYWLATCAASLASFFRVYLICRKILMKLLVSGARTRNFMLY